MSRRLTFYSREGCHLCELMYVQVDTHLNGSGIQFDTIDIDRDPDLKARFDWRVPVLADGDEIICEGRLDEAALLDFLQESSRESR